MIVQGGAGSGKTALLDEVCELTELECVRVSANSAEASTPLSGLSALLASGPVTETRLPQPGSRPDAAELLAIAQRLILSLRREPGRLRLVVIDDIDLLDEASRTVLGYVARRLAGTGIRALGSANAISALSPFHGIPQLSLEPLSQEALLELVTDQVGGDLSPSVLRVIADSAEGNPAAALDIAQSLRPEQLAGAEPLPLPFRPSPEASRRILAALGGLSPEARQLIPWISAASSVPLAALSFVPEGARSALPELLNSGLVSHVGEGIAIRNPRLRSAVYWAQSTGERSAIFSSLQLATAPPMLAWLASFSDCTSGNAGALRAGAARLIRGGTHLAGIELAERASVLERPDGGNAPELVVIAEELLSRGEMEHARHYADQTNGLPLDGGLRLRVVGVQLAVEYFLSQRVISLNADSVIAEHGAGHPVCAAQLQLLMAAFTTERWDYPAAAAMLRRAEGMPGAAHPQNALLLTAVRSALDALVSGAAPAAHTPQSPQSEGWLWGPLTDLLIARAYSLVEEYERSRSLLDAVLSNSGAKSPLWVAAARLQSVELERRAGNAGTAITVMGRIVQSGAAPDVLRHARALNTAWYWQERSQLGGRPDSLAAARDHSLGRRNLRLNGVADALQGSYALRSGALDEALPPLLRCREGTAHFRNSQLLRFEGDLAEVLARLGDRETAVEVIEELRERAASTPSRWATLVLLRTDAFLLSGEASIRAFEGTLLEFRQDELRFELGHTQALFTERLAELGDEVRSRQLLLAAQATYREIGLPNWADAVGSAATGRVRSELHPLLLHLSEPQRQVVDLVISGYKNREIASKLFVSVRTVEVRLTSVYKKLGLKSRYELLARIGAPEEAFPPPGREASPR